MKPLWPIKRLGDLKAPDKHSLAGGPFGSNLVSHDYVSDGVPVIRGCNLPADKTFSFDDLVFITEAKADSLLQNNAHPGDMIFTQRGTLGQVGLIPDDSPFPRFVISQSQMKLTVDQKKAEKRFLYQYFRMASTVEAIKARAISSGVPHINLATLRKFEVLAPPVYTQRKIAAILTAYDDLIETNKRRIALLEKMAEEIYREWFVRMRFPGYKGAVFHKGLPATWQTKRIREIVDRKKFGRVYRENELFNEGLVIVVDQSRADYLGFYDGKPEHEASPEKPILLFGDHSCKMVFMTKPFSLAENVIPFTPTDDIAAHYLFHLVKDVTKTTEYKRHWTDLANRQVMIPERYLQDSFREIIRENHAMREALAQEIRVLTKTRDLLLPRLISGKLSVADLDIQFPPSMREEIEGVDQ